MTLRRVLPFFVLIGLFGCNGQAPGGNTVTENRPKANSTPKYEVRGEGLDLLKKVMEKYHGAKTFQANSKIDYLPNSDEKQLVSAERMILVENPNKFRLMGAMGNMKILSISDGSKVLEHSTSSGEIVPAPSDLSVAASEMAGNFQLLGSLLYKFFAESKYPDSIVDPTRGKVELLPGKQAGTSILRFYAIEPYGDTEITVNTADNTIYQIVSHMDRVVADSANLEKDYRLNSLIVTEKFTKQEFGAPIEAKAFDTTAPAGVKVVDHLSDPSGNGTNVGAPVPNATLFDKDDHEVKLINQKDQILLIDFWATWCNPCRKSLPDTLEFFHKYNGKGLKVMAVTDEDKQTVDVFLNEANLKDLPVFFDKGGKANAAFGITGIPTIVIVDRKGRVSAFMVGMQDPHDVEKELRKAGLDL